MKSKEKERRAELEEKKRFYENAIVDGATPIEAEAMFVKHKELRNRLFLLVAKHLSTLGGHYTAIEYNPLFMAALENLVNELKTLEGN